MKFYLIPEVGFPSSLDKIRTLNSFNSSAPRYKTSYDNGFDRN